MAKREVQLTQELEAALPRIVIRLQGAMVLFRGQTHYAGREDGDRPVGYAGDLRRHRSKMELLYPNDYTTTRCRIYGLSFGTRQ
jgi:hypothetical protein